jgi:biotin carboxyl carrier protein
MKYFVTIGDENYEVAVDGSQITVDGEPVTADMRHVGTPDLYSLLLDHSSHEVLVQPPGEQRNVYDVLVEGTRYVVKVQDERSRRLALADRRLKAPASELAVKAPIPGLVVKVVATPGESVSEGQTLLMLEAMKMENDVRAPRAGVIHEVRVQAGDQVTLGQVMITLK